MTLRRLFLSIPWSLSCLLAAGCAPGRTIEPAPPSLAPAAAPAVAAALPAGAVATMYYRLLPVDQAAVVRIASAQSLEIQAARQRVAAARGGYLAALGGLFPIVSPGLAVQQLDGINQNANGSLTHANFTNLLPGVLLDWIVNPGRVIYDIVAARRQLQASRRQAQATIQQTLHTALWQYDELVLAQAKVAAARQSVDAAAERQRLQHLLRINGNGLPADDLRAAAETGRAQDDLIASVNAFYRASIALALSLHLDATVMLVPSEPRISATARVDDAWPIDVLLATAMRYRPDLQAARQRLAAAQAEHRSALWSALGPQFQAAYSDGSLAAHVAGEDDRYHAQQKGAASLSFAWSAAGIGQAGTAKAQAALAALDADGQWDRARAEVVAAHQASLAAAQQWPIATQRLASAQEAWRLVQLGQRQGRQLPADVLQAQAALAQARLEQVEAAVRYDQAQLDLLAALGLVDARRLAAPQAAAANDAPGVAMP